MNSLSLANLIETTPDLAALIGDPAALLTALNAKTIQRMNTELQTVAVIPVAFRGQDPTIPFTVFAVLEAAEQTTESFGPYLRVQLAKFKSTGLDLSAPEVQSMIDQIFVGPYADLAAPLKALGVWMESIATNRLNVAMVYEADLTAALAILAKRDLQRAASARWNAVSAAIETGEVTTIEEAAALFGE
jgi:hypothetical protein